MFENYNEIEKMMKIRIENTLQEVKQDRMFKMIRIRKIRRKVKNYKQ